MSKYDEKQLAKAVAEAAEQLEGYDREFFQRVWLTNLEVFRNRLQAIGLTGREHVLDAGCGNGQWTLCLAELNNQVTAVDISQARTAATDHVLDAMAINNVTVQQSSIDATKFTDSTFDAVFCYSTLYFTDHRKTLREFARVMKPGGTLYICTNGPGWYIHNMIEPHNPSRHFDIPEMSIKAIGNTIGYFSEGKYKSGFQLAVPRCVLESECHNAGFEDVQIADEGTLNPLNKKQPTQFFKPEFYGQDGVYELLCRKPRKPEKHASFLPKFAHTTDQPGEGVQTNSALRIAIIGNQSSYGY
ncbi:MAG: methyltransferase domain-containing protein, partial [Rubripirellula sp.]|nr:methyltransferase domain-containing protein [Rubripirellula sp.]